MRTIKKIISNILLGMGIFVGFFGIYSLMSQKLEPNLGANLINNAIAMAILFWGADKLDPTKKKNKSNKSILNNKAIKEKEKHKNL